MMLASNGWQRASKKALKNGHASHVHNNCDCSYAVRFDDNTEVEGYDPDYYKDIYDNAEGDTWEQKTNYLRRKNYAIKKSEINAQRRLNYENKKLLEFLSKNDNIDFKEAVNRYGLTYSESKALSDYLSSDSYIINEKLRKGEKLTSKEELLCKNLDSALSKIPTYSGNLSRSLYFYNEKEIEDYMSRFTVGEIITSKQYISTTKGASLYNPEGQVQIFFADSSKGHDISEFKKAELEVLYDRSRSFLTVKKKKVDGIWYLLLKEV